jgi:UDP-glucose 4-epimerase
MGISGKDIIVAGGAGFIGSNIVERLAPDNKVTVIDSLHTGNEANLKAAMETGNVSFIHDDVKNIGNHGIDGADYIFHTGSYSSTPMYKKNPHLTGEVITGMISVCEYAKENSTKVVFASTSSMYSGLKPPHHEGMDLPVTDYYTEGKIGMERISELYTKLYSLDIAAMRPFSVYGFRETSKGEYANVATQFLWAMKAGRQPVIYGDGSQRRDLTFVTDVVDAFTLAAEKNKGFNTYNIGTGRNYDMNDIVGRINAMLGTDIKPNYVVMPMKNYVWENLADTTKSEKALGFKAKVDVDKGLSLINEHYK